MLMIAITALSTLVALVMSGVAWRASRAERVRSEARIAALAREIHGDSDPSVDLDLRPQAAGVALSRGLFGSTAAEAPRDPESRWGVVVAAGGLVIASIVAAAVVFGGEAPAAAIATPAPKIPAAAPLELMALGHDRENDQLIVRGAVRNPASGTPMEGLTAVVFLFDSGGGFIASGRAAVASPSLVPGGESTFAVTIPAAGAIARYRVSFRSGERIVEHVDRRSGS